MRDIWKFQEKFYLSFLSLSCFYPTISEVVEESTAERCGLQEGDVVVRINNDPTINMTHEDAHQALIAAGSEFVLGVLRFLPPHSVKFRVSGLPHENLNSRIFLFSLPHTHVA